ncbi:hypothetical protein G7046_g2650 [Stylonectria norvegica]|nr:hypothetical protein G7046_g2650 [Stylonectria norvegica]
MDSTESDPVSPLRTPVVHITTHSPAGRAIIHSSDTQGLSPYTGMRTSHKTVYNTSEFPADLNNEADIKFHQQIAASGSLSLVKKSGTVCRIVDFAPGNIPLMHRTQSLDYGVLLEGSIMMELDDGHQMTLAPGDVAIQRATNHVWKNPSSTQWARMLFVLQDCKPLTIDGNTFGEDLGSHSYLQSSEKDGDA